MAKKSGGKTKRQSPTPSTRRVKRAAAAKGAKRKTGGARTAKAKAARKKTSPVRARKLKRTAKPAAARTTRRAAPSRKSVASRKSSAGRPPVKSAKKAPATRKARVRGGSGREETLAQTPETGRTLRGPTNPMPTRRSTGTPAGAGTSRSPRLDRDRKRLREIDETVPSPPSSLDLDSQGPSAARSGRKRLMDAKEEHTETSPVMTGGDVDADWEDAYSVGDEAPGGDNPTPDQDRVDDIGKALGVTYDDNEELKASDKIADRDKHRWELDPASSEDYPDRD
jgi:Family of unknown function (DUF6335)